MDRYYQNKSKKNDKSEVKEEKKETPHVSFSNKAKTKDANLSPKDLALDHPPEKAGQIAKMHPGEVLVFSQFLLHRTHGHLGDHTRWTIQIRYSDASDADFADFGAPLGDNTTILRRQDLRNAMKHLRD